MRRIGVGLGEVLSENESEVDGGGVVLRIGITRGEDVANEVQCFCGGGGADEVGLILGDIGKGVLVDIGHLQMGDGGLEERDDLGGGEIRTGQSNEDEVCFIALKGESDDFVWVAGPAIEEEDGGLVGEIGEGVFEGDERA